MINLFDEFIVLHLYCLSLIKAVKCRIPVFDLGICIFIHLDYLVTNLILQILIWLVRYIPYTASISSLSSHQSSNDAFFAAIEAPLLIRR